MGWPGMGVYSNVSKVKDVLETVRYFDGMNFATRIKADGFFTVGFVDTACPPATVYAALQQREHGESDLPRHRSRSCQHA
jgi:cephalosporin-C deacetylase